MSHTAQQLLDLAAPHAARSVRLARQYLGKAASIDTQALRWRRISTTLAAIAPILLLAVIAGSLIQTNSALVETLWEFTAGAMLLAGVGIAIADSRGFFLRSINADTPLLLEEVHQVEEASELARAWHAVVTQEQRPLRQFDLEIMWALSAHERGDQAQDAAAHH
ncbi:hypothetical protein [Uliginosibacterium sp. 31-12]|uniref:hypothetical protein n=1 Tax=Uliginosibacterium sp. 31-12 TaxID=3062781 RepID=UPI0026E32115|nr:hypothetical protein [Uliginosibacterium sp. 31-12]MDO6388024.1 hypothetical protein [Uliginosibacterium sp. 31-12]